MSDWIGARTVELEVVSGEKYAARTIFADVIAYESTARKHGWPPVKDAGLQTVAFTAWHALRRQKDIPESLTYEAFRDSLVAFRDGSAEPDPTPPGPLPG